MSLVYSYVHTGSRFETHVIIRLPTRATVLAAIIAVVATLSPTPASAVPADALITFAGGGWGHGIGMPQYAARGMAEDGSSHDEILGYFYTGTEIAQIADTNGSSLPDVIRVGTNLAGGEVRPFRWLDFEAVGGPVELCLPGEAPGSCSFTVQPDEAWRVAWSESSRQCRVLRQGSVVHDSNECGFRLEWDDQPGTKVSIPEVGRLFARGAIEFSGPVTYTQRGFHLVIELQLDEYLYGLAEMPTSWPAEALEAQVVAARTFAAETTRRRMFVYAGNEGLRPDCSCHLLWGTSDQSYRGWHSLNEGNPDHGDDWRRAVDETSGEVVIHPGGSGLLAETYYHSSSGGATENVWDVWGSSPTKYSYLASVPDPWSERYADESSRIRWTMTMTVSDVAAALSFDEIASMDIEARYESGSPSDIVVTGRIGGQTVTRHYTGGQIKTMLGLTSHHIYSIDGFTEPERIAGANRYETAVAASQQSHPDGSDVVYVAVGTNHPDALAAGPAASVEGAPILLIQFDGIPSATEAELRRLDPAQVVVLGGPVAIAPSTVAGLESILPGAGVVRRAGDDRYETAVEISKAVFDGPVETLYVATGRDFPDALVAAPAAVADGAPLLLVPSRIPDVVWSEIVRLGPSRIVAVGGTIPDDVVSRLGTIAEVEHIDAADRYAVSAAVSASSHSSGSDVAYIAVGDDFPDALAAGPLTAYAPGPLLLVRTGSLPGSVAAELERLDPSRIVIFGGPAAVSEDVALLLGTYED
jgi:SpoIID/LytB domain protein